MRQASHAGPATHGSERVPTSPSHLRSALASVIADLVTLTQVHQLRASVVEHHRSLLPLADVMFARLVDDVLHVAYDENEPPENAHQLALLPVDLDLPISQAARTARPVIVTDRASINDAYPLLAAASQLQGVCAVPVTPPGEPETVLGVVSYWFDEPVELSDEELEHLRVLAHLSFALCPQGEQANDAASAVARVVRLRSVPLLPDATDDPDADEPESDDPRYEVDEDVLDRIGTLEREVAAMRELLRFISAITHERVGPT